MKTTIRGKTIIHLDIDAFFPAVEILDNPALKGKAIIVGGSLKRGVVSSASYEARKFGVHSAQPISRAKRLCPQGIFLPVRMTRYKEISAKVFEIFYRFSPLVEPLSIDEAFIDVTGCQRIFGHPEDIAKKIKSIITHEIGLTVSAGIAPSKFIAKIASDINKPDGLTIVKEDEIKEFLAPLPIDKLWGVGRVTKKTLVQHGIKTIGDLSLLSPKVLQKKLGRHGLDLHRLSLGIDNREVTPGREIKSIGREETFPEDIIDKEAVRKELLSLAVKVSKRMRDKSKEGRTITLKVKYPDFVQITRSETLPAATDDGAEIFQVACRLLFNKTEAGQRPIRLLGISLSYLRPHGESEQPLLFQTDKASFRKKNLNLAIDKINKKFGEEALVPGTLLKKKTPP